MRWLRKLGLSLSIPALLTGYSLFLSSATPRGDVLAPVVLAALMCLLVVVEGTFLLALLAWIRRLRNGRSAGEPSLPRALVAASLRAIRDNARDLLLLNLYTCLGPPLWFLSVIFLSAEPANWLDLGATPVLTLLLAIALIPEERPRHWTGWLAILPLVLGICVFLWRMDYGRRDHLLGVVFALVSALGTAAASFQISRMRRELSSLALLPLRYLLPSACLVVLWVASAWSLGLPLLAGRLIDLGSLLVGGSALFVVPCALYVAVVRSYGVKFTAFLWALLPVFTSLAASLWTTRRELSMASIALGGGLILAGYALDVLHGELRSRKELIATVVT